MEELKELLLEKNYPKTIIDNAIKEASKIPRKVALFRMTKKKENKRRPVFETKFDPRISALQPIIAKHWRSMNSQDKHLNFFVNRLP